MDVLFYLLHMNLRGKYNCFHFTGEKIEVYIGKCPFVQQNRAGMLSLPDSEDQAFNFHPIL